MKVSLLAFSYADPAGWKRELVKAPDGSVERVVKVDAGAAKQNAGGESGEGGAPAASVPAVAPAPTVATSPADGGL